MKYKVLDDTEVKIGTAEDILQQIIQKNGANEEIRQMTVFQYADALINNAEFYLPKAALDSLRSLTFETKFDKALRYLSTMPSSGATIIATEENLK